MTALITIDTTNVRRSIDGRIAPRTREAWLNRGANALRATFEENGAIYPDRLRFSMSWAGGRGKKGDVLGQYWRPEASADGTGEVLVSPTLDKPLDVLAVLAHELCHACLPFDAGHGPKFKRLATAIGLTGKMTATVPGPELIPILLDMADKIGPYPHAELREGPASDKPKKQTTRMIKCECPRCGYLVRTTRSWLETGNPVCGPCGREMVPEGQEDDGDE